MKSLQDFVWPLGKIIGGGFPLAALGASTEIMKHFNKAHVGADKWLMQLGTLSGNPVAAAAGLKTMDVLSRERAYDNLRATGRALQKMQTDALTQAGIPHQICGDETLFDIYFTNNPCRDYRSASKKLSRCRANPQFSLFVAQYQFLRPARCRSLSAFPSSSASPAVR